MVAAGSPTIVVTMGSDGTVVKTLVTPGSLVTTLVTTDGSQGTVLKTIVVTPLETVLVIIVSSGETVLVTTGDDSISLPPGTNVKEETMLPEEPTVVVGTSEETTLDATPHTVTVLPLGKAVEGSKVMVSMEPPGTEVNTEVIFPDSAVVVGTFPAMDVKIEVVFEVTSPPAVVEAARLFPGTEVKTEVTFPSLAVVGVVPGTDVKIEVMLPSPAVVEGARLFPGSEVKIDVTFPPELVVGTVPGTDVNTEVTPPLPTVVGDDASLLPRTDVKMDLILPSEVVVVGTVPGTDVNIEVMLPAGEVFI